LDTISQDAYFVRHDALGVADGVGGWSGRKGADPGFFAARLMHHCSAELALAEQLAAEGSPSSSTDSSTEGTKSKKPHLAFVSSASATAHGDEVVENVLDPEAGTTTSRSTKQSSDPEKTTARNSNTQTPPSTSHSYSGTDPAEDGETGEDLHHVLRAGDPIEILHRAWDLTLTEFFDFELIGSSTALIALLKDDELRLANIGDCCCSIIRGSDYIFRSQEQQHSFNYPFQMGTNSKDTPRKDGQKFNIKVQKNDVVILSSDGLVDNLFDEDILEEVLRQQDDALDPSSTTSSSSMGSSEQHASDGSNGANARRAPPLSAEKLSKALCSRAKAVSEDQRAVSSPFQQRANEEGIHFVGGKHDDITVLVAIIGDKQETSTSASASA
jgi:serine/threonine protein phosphatase PrpC